MAIQTLPLGICGGLDDAAAVLQAGADYLEVNVQVFLAPGDPDETRFEANLASADGLCPPVRNACLFLPASLPCVGPAVDDAVLLAYAGRAFARAKKAGVRHIVFGSGGARKVPAGFPMARAKEQMIEFLQNIAPLAGNEDVTVVIEPLNAQECNFINTLAEGAELIEACGHPNVRLLGDTYHMGFSNEGPETVRRFGSILRHFHVAGYPARRYPGAEGESYREWFTALREIDYAGSVSVECRWENMATEAGPALANLRRDLVAAGYAASV